MSPRARRPAFIDPFQPSQIKRLVREFGSPLLIVDCERVRVQLRKLRHALPRVDLHYALKPLPHPAVVRTIVAGSEWMNQSRNLAAVASNERPSTMALMMTV